MGRKRSAKVQAFIEQRIARGQCLTPSCNGSSEQPGAGRGKCPACFQAFRRKIANRSIEEQLADEAEEIRNGLMLNRYELRGMKPKKQINRKRSVKAG